MRPFLALLLRWALPLLLGAAALAYSAYRFHELQYWDGAVGNWLATLFGIVVGVPVALHIERQRTAAVGRADAEAASASRRSVLTILCTELEAVRSQMLQRLSTVDSVSMEPLRSSSWEAMKASGGLRHISEPTLIEAMSNAYRWISILGGLESSALRAVFGVNVQFPDGQLASVKLLQHAVSFHGPVLTALGAAIAVLHAELGASPPVR